MTTPDPAPTTRLSTPSRTAVRARAALRVELDADGTARIAELRSAVPVILRRTGGSGRVVVIHLVGGAGGPLAGDDLGLDIAVGAGAHLVVRSVAATVALPGHGAGPSTFAVHAQVGPAAALSWLPEPTVVAAGARHRMTTEITLTPDSSLRYREEILLGRFGEPGGSLTTSLRVDVDVDREAPPAPSVHPASSVPRRRPLLCQELRLGPDLPGAAGPAVLAGARAIGSVLVAGPATSFDSAAGSGSVADGVAALRLAGPGALVSALAGDAVTLRRRLDALAGPLTGDLADTPADTR
ncbi:urease accessory protein UreD [Frankia sp. CcI49]|uniref:urease accessory protein UreD n=1 Tax=unclassified Frankia TaxID=2632575 RepID=UPI0006CA13D8|nr:MULTISPECIES: urease accessory protein UreD [unclassified Frankia]KPM56829.1 urease accessory protein UreD [Frankia sp. R43]ONH50589.1 urease accessory protein UreD [Frankia sp. CcI49]